MKTEKQPGGFLRMLSLKLNTEIPKKRKISISKFITRILKKARTNAKRATCHICGNECSSFCKSHSVPQFALQNIAEQGNVHIPLQGEMLTTGDDTGIKSAGVFFLICNNCDNTRFGDYENPDVYNVQPNDKMLAEISLKNYLQMIYKRRIDPEIYSLLDQRFDNFSIIPGKGKTIQEIDLEDYQRHFQYALRALSGKNAPRFHLYYYTILDYRVPCATQTAIPLIVDLEDNLINNVYNISEEYRIAHLHVAIFPLKETSAIMLFCEQGEKRYRRFFRQFRKLNPEDQLAAINYMIFSYTENVFVNPTVYKLAWKNKGFRKVCRKTTNVLSFAGIHDPIKTAIQAFSFSNRYGVPNLLSREYALKCSEGEMEKEKRC